MMRILAASDLSGPAALGIERAASLARRHGGELHVVHVVGDDDAEPEVAEATLALREQIGRIDAAQGAQLDVIPGKPFVAIVRHARALGADLVVLGAHGAHSVADAVMGTTAERIVRKGDRPVLVVKRPPRGEYERGLVALDFSEHSVEALEYALALLPGCELEIAHVFTMIGQRAIRATPEQRAEFRRLLEREARAGIESVLRDAGTPPDGVRIVVEEGRPEVVLAKLGARRDVDLLVVGTHGMGAFRQVLLGSVAQHVLRDAPCDVLAVRRGSPVFELP